MIVTIGNPLLAAFEGCKYGTGTNKSFKKSKLNQAEEIENILTISKQIKEKLQTGYVESILESYLKNKLNTNKTLKLKDYLYDEKKHTPGKNTVEQSLNLKSDDVSNVLREINEEFSSTTGVPSISDWSEMKWK